MAEDHLPESSVPACMVHCLEKPDISHIMVSYREPNFLGIGGQFNCICAKVLNPEIVVCQELVSVTTLRTM